MCDITASIIFYLQSRSYINFLNKKEDRLEYSRNYSLQHLVQLKIIFNPTAARTIADIRGLTANIVVWIHSPGASAWAPIVAYMSYR